MQRVTLTSDDELLAELDGLIGKRGYTGRSEAIRDLARAGLRQALLETDEAPDCVAAVVHVYDHATRDPFPPPVPAVSLADAVLAQRGVRHGRLIIVPVVQDAGEHSHDGHTHAHVRAR